MDYKDFSSLELKEFYSFLHKISNFEKIYQIQSDSIIFILWGIIFIISAVSETFLNLTPGFKLPIVIWIISITLGGLLTVTIENQVTFLRKKTFNIFDIKLLQIISLIAITIIICEFILQVNFLVSPLLGIQFFYFSYNPTRLYAQENKDFIYSKITRLIPFAGFISACVNLVILLIATTLVNPSATIEPLYFSNFEILIFAIFVGPILIISGLLNNKKIQKYFRKLNDESE